MINTNLGILLLGYCLDGVKLNDVSPFRRYFCNLLVTPDLPEVDRVSIINLLSMDDIKLIDRLQLIYKSLDRITEPSIYALMKGK